MEDDRVSLLEQQLAQAKLIAEEADKKYEEVYQIPLDYLVFDMEWKNTNRVCFKKMRHLYICKKKLFSECPTYKFKK